MQGWLALLILSTTIIRGAPGVARLKNPGPLAVLDRIYHCLTVLKKMLLGTEKYFAKSLIANMSLTDDAQNLQNLPIKMILLALGRMFLGWSCFDYKAIRAFEERGIIQDQFGSC